MIKKLLLLPLLAVSLTVSAQVTWFGKTTGPLGSPSSGITEGLQTAVRLPDGRIALVHVADGGNIGLQLLQTDGSPIESFVTSSMPSSGITTITGAELSNDGTAILVTGSSVEDWTYVTNFVIAKIDIATKAVTVTQHTTNTPYTASPCFSQTTDGIYAIYPKWNYSMVAKYDQDLNPLWARGFVPDSTDTTWAKHPSMGGTFTDSSVVVCSKDESQLSVAEYSASGAPIAYWLFPLTGYTRIYSMQTLQDGNLILTGFQDSSPIVAKMSKTGNVFWAKQIMGTSLFYSFDGTLELADGTILAFCSSGASGNHQQSGFCKFDANGNLLGMKWMGITDSYSMGKPVVDANGLLMAGSVFNYTTYTTQGVVQYTSMDLEGSCDAHNMLPIAVDFDLGTPTNLGAGGVDSWSISLPPASSRTMVAITAPGHTVCSTVTSTDNASLGSLTLAPNPVAAGAEALVSFPNAGDYTLRIMDVTGKALVTRTVRGSEVSIPTEGMVPGVYVVTLLDASGATSTQKLVVQ